MHRSRNKQRSRDLRHSMADSRSDYYNNRRPQSVSLGAQIPAFTIIHSASSVSALGTISENEAMCGSSPHIVFTHDSDRESIFADPPETPIFNYNPTSSVAKVDKRSKDSPYQKHQRVSRTSLSVDPQVTSPGHEPLSRIRSNGFVNVPTTTTPIHASEPITQEFVPLYLNPLTGQMYSHNQDYFRPISSPNEVITRPPKPVS